MKRGSKWLIMLAAFATAFYMGSTIDVAPINNRAIVVGLALDGEEGSLEVSAQILTTTASESNQTESKIISAEAKTVAASLAKISEYTSMDLSLAHCNFLVIGESLLKTNAFAPVDYLVRNAYLSENALLTGCTGKAKDVLDSEVAFDQMSSFYAQRTLETHSDYDDVTVGTVKRFVAERMKRNPSNYLTLIEKLPLGGGSRSAATEESSATGKETDKEEFYFSMTKTAVFYADKMVGTLDEDETSGLNYALDEVDNASIEFYGREGRLIDLYVVKSKTKTVCDKEKRTARYEIEIGALIKEIDAPSGIEADFVMRLCDEEIAIAENAVREKVEKCYLKCLSLGVDIFDVGGALYRLYKLEDVSVDENTVSVNVKIKVQ